MRIKDASKDKLFEVAIAPFGEYWIKWETVLVEILKKYEMPLISRGPHGIRFQFAPIGKLDDPYRTCITAKTEQEAVQKGKKLLKAKVGFMPCQH